MTVISLYYKEKRFEVCWVRGAMRQFLKYKLKKPRSVKWPHYWNKGAKFRQSSITTPLVMTDSAFPNPNKEMRLVIARIISFIQGKCIVVEKNNTEGCTNTRVFHSSQSLYLVLQVPFSYSLYLNLPPAFLILKKHPTKLLNYYTNHCTYIKFTH